MMTAFAWAALALYTAGITMLLTGAAMWSAATEGNNLKLPGLCSISGGFLVLVMMTGGLAL